MKKITLVVLAAMVLTVSLAWAANFKCCMTRKTVTSLFGNPAHKTVNGSYEQWTYKWADNLEDDIDFKKDKLVKVYRWACSPTGRRLRIVDSMICDDCE